ncbi:MAG TPA: carbohydrate kinase family protein [Thermoplasmatales archaeon]|nr:carbohydrate kinase family protein [Thermoplasmatales archaeon]
MKKITVVGHSAFDYIFIVDSLSPKNQSSYIKEWKRCYGGGGANISIGIAKMRGKSRLYTVGGKDFKRYENFLNKNNVELILKRSNEKTARAYVFNAENEQIMYFYWGASVEMKNMKGIKSEYLHIAPCHPKLALRMAEKADFFAFEPGQDLKKFEKKDISYIIEKADIVFCNETELMQINKMTELRGKEVIVTLGNKGSLIYKSGIKIPAITCRTVDTTGAGDAYKAGFWVGFMKGFEIEKCCKIGTAVSSFVVEKIGAQNFPSMEKLSERYKNYFGEKIEI